MLVKISAVSATTHIYEITAFAPESATTAHKRSNAQTAHPAPDSVLLGKMLEGNLEQKKTKTLMAVIGLAALGAVAAWQFYLFAVFKNADGVVDVQGGTIHLWLAIGTTLIVCIAGFFLFSGFLRYDKKNEIHITSPGPVPGDGRTRRNIL
jgi:hypothetical protein